MISTPINLQYTTIKEPLPDFIYNRLKDYSTNANTYKPQPPDLIDKLSGKYKIKTDNIYLTAGADEAIQMFAKAYGSNAFTLTPTYTVYSDVRIFGGKLTEIYSINGNKFEIDAKNIPGASLIFLANPNNPSGFTSKNKVIELVKNNPSSIVVIDEAYGDFAPELSVIDQVTKFENLAVLRSFSKGYSMAGNRIGFIVSSKKIISKVKDFTQWSNVSYLSVGAATIALDHEDYFQNLRNDIAVRRESFMEFLTKNGFSVLPTKINAVVVHFEGEKEGIKFFEYLDRKNIVTSHGNGNSNIGLDKSFVRIAIGIDSQMNKVKEIIKKFVK